MTPAHIRHIMMLSLRMTLVEMSITFILLLGSIAVGLMIAPRHNVYMLLGSTPILAVVVATESQLAGFGLLASVAITVVCVALSQMAYLLLLWLTLRHELT
jgi:hypothetical protein